MKTPTMRSLLTPRRVVAALLTAVAGAVLLFHVFSGGGGAGRPAQLAPTPSAVTSTAPTTAAPAPTTAPPAVEDHTDDGVADTVPPPINPTEQMQVREAAAAFAAVWLNAFGQSKEQWHTAVAKRVTEEQATALAGVEPRGQVPVGYVGDKVEPVLEGSLWTAIVPILDRRGGTEIGKLSLVVVLATNATFREAQWLISEIDWEPKR